MLKRGYSLRSASVARRMGLDFGAPAVLLGLAQFVQVDLVGRTQRPPFAGTLRLYDDYHVAVHDDHTKFEPAYAEPEIVATAVG